MYNSDNTYNISELIIKYLLFHLKYNMNIIKIDIKMFSLFSFDILNKHDFMLPINDTD